MEASGRDTVDELPALGDGGGADATARTDRDRAREQTLPARIAGGADSGGGATDCVFRSRGGARGMARAARTRNCAGERDGEAVGEDGGDGAGVRIGGARAGAGGAGERNAAGGRRGQVHRESAGRSELRRSKKESHGSAGTSDADQFAGIACVWKYAVGPGDAGCRGVCARSESGERTGGHGEFARLGDLALAPGEKI